MADPERHQRAAAKAAFETSLFNKLGEIKQTRRQQTQQTGISRVDTPVALFAFAPLAIPILTWRFFGSRLFAAIPSGGRSYRHPGGPEFKYDLMLVKLSGLSGSNETLVLPPGFSSKPAGLGIHGATPPFLHKSILILASASISRCRFPSSGRAALVKLANVGGSI